MNTGSLRGKKLKLDHTLLPVMGSSKGWLIIKNNNKMALEL